MSLFVQQLCDHPTGSFLTKDVVRDVLRNSANEFDRTQSSNLAERRKIQNRIAQRSYRRKHKIDLKNLERQFGTSDTRFDVPKKTATTRGRPLPKSRSQSLATKHVVSQDRFPPVLPSIEPSENLFFPGTFYNRERPNCTPLIKLSNNHLFPGTCHDQTSSNSLHQLADPTSSAPDEITIVPYGVTQPDTATTSADSYDNFLIAPTVPMTLPSMTQFNDTIRRLESFSPYNPFKNHAYNAGRLSYIGA